MAITRKSWAHRTLPSPPERPPGSGPDELRRALLRRDREIERLRHERDQLQRRVEALEAAGDTLVSTGNLAETPHSMTKVITEAVRADAGSIMLVDHETHDLIFEVATGEKGEEVKQFRLTQGDGIAGWVAETGQATIVNEPQADARHRHDIPVLIGYDTRNLMAAPMRVGEQLIGVVEVLNRQDGQPFTPGDLVLLESLATLAAVAIQNSRAFADAQKRIQELGLLIGVGQAISGMTNLEELLDTAMFMATKVLNAEASACMRLDPTGEYLDFTAAIGEKSDEVRRQRCRVGEGVAGWVAQHGEPLLVRNTGLDPRFTGHMDQRTQFQTRSILAVPIKVGDRLLGVLEVLNPVGDRHFDDHDLEMLCTVASQVGVAIQNTQLMTDTRHLFLGTVEALAAALDARHPYTHGHARTVAALCAATADEMQLRGEYRESLHLTALLHDFGKIGIARSILDKPGPLTAEEWAIVKQHPATGAEIVAHMEHPVMKRVAQALQSHHEWWDGTGYPDGLAGERIPVESRIVSVVDAFCVMVCGRPYRPAQSEEQTLAEIERCAGTQFDPAVAEALIASRRANPFPIVGRG